MERELVVLRHESQELGCREMPTLCAGPYSWVVMEEKEEAIVTLPALCE